MKPTDLTYSYTIPALHCANGNVQKQWFVDFFITCNETGVRQRIKRTNKCNYIKDKKDRLAALKSLHKNIIQTLESGGLHTFLGKVSKVTYTKIVDNNTSIAFINSALQHKLAYIKDKAMLKCRIDIFTDWLTINGYAAYKINALTPNIISAFATFLSAERKVSNRTRNNYMVDLSGIFETIRKNQPTKLIINPCTGLQKVPNRSEKNKVYTEWQLTRIDLWMQDNDIYLKSYCEFFTYLGMRPNEALHIRIEQINFVDGYIELNSVDEKNGKPLKKYIQHFYLPKLLAMNLHTYPPNYYVWGSEKQPGLIMIGKDFFSKRFKRMKKPLGLSKAHTMYSLRHTFVISLVRANVPFREIMKITGHKTLDAFQHYVQQYLDEPPIDISASIKPMFI